MRSAATGASLAFATLLMPAVGMAAPADPAGVESNGPLAILEGGLPGTFQIPNTGLSMGFGGYVKLDVNVSSRGAESPGGVNEGDQFVIPALIPVGEMADDGYQLTLNARESRVWWKAFMPTDWGNFNAYVEIDFYAFQAPGNERVSNSFAPRLRHAYGTLGPLLAGQTWSTFMNASSLPDNLDFVGSVGAAFDRQPQVRWTQPVVGPFSIMVAVESPETTATSSVGARVAPGDDRIPDFVVGARADGTFGNVTLTFLARELRIDDGDETTLFAGGASLAGRVFVGERDNVRFNLVAGSGLGRYVGLNTINDAYLNEDGELRATIPTVSGHIAYQHHWSKLFRSSATFSFLQAFNPEELTNQAVTDQVLGGIVNLLFSPIPRTTFGVEYNIVRRTVETGEEGVLHRFQSSAKFVF
jgi:hypothetical protein